MPAGRPKRKDNPAKITLYLSEKSRKRISAMAFKANQSSSQFLDSLIQGEFEAQRAGK